MSGESKCKRCGALIVWVEMAETERNMPLDPVPTEQGTIEKRRGDVSGSWYGFNVPKAERKGRLYLSHFATCPNANEFRKGNEHGRQATQTTRTD